jgi:hypothetical protein
VDDGLELKEPLEPKDGTKLIYIRAFDEMSAQIVSSEEDKTNPRYGQPTMYSMTFDDRTNYTRATTGVCSRTEEVHHTRVIHIADNTNSSQIFGVPRLRSVYNNVLNLRKLIHGSAEMYWKGAFPGLAIETHPSLGGDVEVDNVALKDMMEDYQNGLQRYLSLMGMTAKSLAPQVVDPTPQIDAQLQIICIKLATPKRVFTGSERGELASSQDTKHWNGRLAGRRDMYITLKIIVPFIDRLIQLGILPQPEQYNIVWPDQESLTEAEQAEIAAKRTEALAKYVMGDVSAIIEPFDFFTRILAMTEEEADAIIATASKTMDKGKFEPRIALPEKEQPLGLPAPGAKGQTATKKKPKKTAVPKDAKKKPKLTKTAVDKKKKTTKKKATKKGPKK